MFQSIDTCAGVTRLHCLVDGKRAVYFYKGEENFGIVWREYDGEDVGEVKALFWDDAEVKTFTGLYRGAGEMIRAQDYIMRRYFQRRIAQNKRLLDQSWRAKGKPDTYGFDELNDLADSAGSAPDKLAFIPQPSADDLFLNSLTE